ncbi:MAG: DUF1826 domain-containing protein [Bdellovibrionaceae bacterium]|nr:DUF1826 domain-containing protein [Pseudobdellovibrionaceae bacterium]
MNLELVSHSIQTTHFPGGGVVGAVRRSRKRLEIAERNHVLISGRGLNFPEVGWGRDFEIRLLLTLDDRAALRKFMRMLPKRFDGMRDFWGDYIWLIHEAFCESFDVRYSSLRFSQISHDQCTLFHSDNVLVRLFQTIRGLGTEYLLEDNLNRNGIGGGCNSKIDVKSNGIQRAKEKDILLMRGDKWVNKKGLVHRSPRIEELGLKRLYFCLDAVEDPTAKPYY